MNQNNFRYRIIPSDYLKMGVKLQFLYHLKLVHFLNTSLHHSKTKMKGFVVFLYLMLLYSSIYMY